MIVAIFVAGESYKGRNNEFPLYQKTFYAQKKKDELIESCPQKNGGGFLGKGSSGTTPPTFVCFKGMDEKSKQDYAVFAVEKNSGLKVCTHNLEQNQSKFKADDARAILQSLSALFKTVATSTPIDIFLFSHWHAADPLAAEQSLNKELDNIGQNEITKLFGVDVQSIKTYALSSLRDDLFDLKNIFVPLTYNGISDLIERFDEDGEYFNPNIKSSEAINKFLISKYSITVNHQGTMVEPKPEIGKNVHIQGVRFIIVATNDKWPKWPIYAIKEVLSAVLKAHNAIVNDYDELRQAQQKAASENCYVIPIFINDRKDRKVGSVSAVGACPPSEFILDCEKECGLGGDKKWNIDKVLDTLIARLQVWNKDGTLQKGVRIDELRDWMAGAFRKYCFLDERAHGMSGDMNLSEAQEHPRSFILRWLGKGDEAVSFRKHFCFDNVTDIPDWVCLLRCLYAESFRQFENLINMCSGSLLQSIESAKADYDFHKWYSVLGEETKRFVDLVMNIFRLEENGGAIPSPQGLATHFMTPSKTVRVLLVDDNAAEECKEDGRLTDKNFPGFEFTSLMTGREKFSRKELLTSFDEAFKVTIKGKEGQAKCSFDAVLLDLCLDSERQDPSGYQLISRIRGQMPNVPIIVYSQFDDMGHEKRAFDEGAAWFLKKSEYKKLARHLNSLFRKPEWQGEWRAIQEIGRLTTEDVFVFEDADDDVLRNRLITSTGGEYAYLIYKALRTLPGKKIYMKRIGAGYGGAMTIKAWKGSKSLSPVIIKVDSRFNTVMEYERYFRFIRPFLANECGRIENPAISIDNEHSVIVYTFAGRAGNRQGILSLRSMLEADMESPDRCSDGKYSKILGRILNEMLPRLHNIRVKGETDKDDIFGASTSFPNPALDEVPNDIMHFSDNYIYRLPLERRMVGDYRFVSQRYHSDSAKSFVLRGGWNASEGRPARIELCDDYKQVLALSGKVAEHVLKFRNHLVPGSCVWIEGDSSELGVNERLLNSTLLENASWVDGEDSSADGSARNALICRLRSEFGRLISSFFADTDDRLAFPHLMKNKWGEQLLRHLRAGNWDFVMELANVLGIVNISDSDGMLRMIIESGELKCPCGIIHGDLNLGNIMVEVDGEGLDGVWLIDFARTRRDFITHDFNVLFTSVLSLLFNKTLWEEKSYSGEKSHSDLMKERFADIVYSVVFRENDGAPKLLPEDSRVRMIYVMLRQIREAALKALQGLDGDPLVTYAYATALMCFVAARVFLQHEKNPPAAAGMIVATLVCCEHLLALKGK